MTTRRRTPPVERSKHRPVFICSGCLRAVYRPKVSRGFRGGQRCPHCRCLVCCCIECVAVLVLLRRGEWRLLAPCTSRRLAGWSEEGGAVYED